MALRASVRFCVLIFLPVLLSYTPTVRAQTLPEGDWTWMGGSSTIPSYLNEDSGSPGVYGALGKFAPGNAPGSRYGASTWVDPSGNLWLFGGDGYAANGTAGYLNDLWEYSPATNQWAWMGGPSTTPGTSLADGNPGIYGTLGAPSITNIPGGRANALAWVDFEGNFWLFGGYGSAQTGAGVLNDLWEYKPFTREWTWMGGNNVASDSGVGGISGAYGTMGQASSTSYPGSRSFSANWTDVNGNLWLFGGAGFDSAGTNGELNDLWKYDPVANEWTWVSGSSMVPDAMLGQPGVYGTQGTPSPGNTPGGREIGAGWTDKTGNLWLFGGGGESDFFNDLWEYNPVTNEWTWMAGSSTAAGYGTYGNLGVPSVNNSPGGRVYSAGWTDENGNLWLFGGNGFAGNGYGGLMDDLWEFLPASSEWVWMGGSSNGVVAGQPGVYGTIASSAAANLPGTRDFAAAWTDNHGIFWLFGGWGNDSANDFGYLSDLWNYQVAGTVPPAAAPSFSPVAGTYQLGQTITLSDSADGASIYYTTDGKTVPTVNSTLYSGPISLTNSETIQAIAVTSGSPISYVAGAAYSVATAPPTFGVPAGTYTSMQTVTITDATAGATIYYTTDGSAPTTSSTVYQSAITVSKSETLSAIAVAGGFSGSTVAAAAYTINLPSPDFSVAASPASITVNAGQAGTVTVTITPSNGFSAAVSFACSGLPSGATCSFSPATITPATAPASTTVTISTSISTANSESNRPLAIPPIVFCLAVGSFFWCKKKQGQIVPLLMLTLCLSMIVLGGCGGGSASTTGLTGTAQSVTSNVTVTASAGSLQHAMVLSLIVK